MDRLLSAVPSGTRSVYRCFFVATWTCNNTDAAWLLQAIFDQFAKQLEGQNMQIKTVTVEPQADDHGIVGKQHDYEGGFVLMAVKHKASVLQWHGDVL